MRIFIIEKNVINVDNDDDAAVLLEQGARELTSEEIATAGMTGFEHLVGPTNTTVTDDGTIVFVPPALSLEEAKLRKSDEIRLAADTALAPLSAEYPYKEVQSFVTQEKEARAFLEDPSASVPLLSAMASRRGIEVAELARRVVAKADTATILTGEILGEAQRDRDRLAAAQTVEEVDAIVPAYKLPEIRK